MSINVTVTGNPVCIKRGKMITCDPEVAKKDFDKRRLVRLEQVRQQSKELAQNIRKKVCKERKRQMGEIEAEGKQKLKNWQNNKLLELQNQYLDALDEIGMGHKQAELFADESELFEKQRQQNEETAKSRGRLAETKLQVQKNEENYKKAMPIQHKKLVRDIENTRAAMVCSMKEKTPKKTGQGKHKKRASKADINISIPNDSDFSEASSSDSNKQLPSIQEEPNQDSEGFCECSDESSDESGSSEDVAAPKSPTKPQKNKQFVEKRSDISVPAQAPLEREIRPQQTVCHGYKDRVDDKGNRPTNVPRDTRISDRINRRQFMATQPDYCDFIAEPTPVSERPESTRIRDKISSRSNFTDQPMKDPLELSSDDCMCTKYHSSCPCTMKSAATAPATTSKSAAVQTDLVKTCQKSCKCGPDKESRSSTKTPSNKTQRTEKDSKRTERESTKTSGLLEEIPFKPPVRLKDATTQNESASGVDRSTVPSGATKVPYYNHSTRFQGTMSSTSQVERIPAESIEVMPNITSEREWYEKMKQRDAEAQMRGKKALEKERVHRDYEEMMKKLPMLQRKEHIAQIGTDKPEYHMSEERLKERERERQNRLENAYANAVPELRPQIVTLPTRKHEVPKGDEPFEILDGDDSRALNLGNWDSHAKKPKTMFSAEEVQEIIKAFTVQKPEDRKAKLKQLLKSLKLQKEQLLNEIRALPKDDSINALISDLNSFSDDDKPRNGKEKKTDKKRHLEESDTSTDTSSHEKRGQKSKSRSKDKYRSPHKKVKRPPPKVRVLQNTSTQTTPKATKEKSSTTTSSTSDTHVTAPKKLEDSLPQGLKICTKSHVPCDCFKEKERILSEEVCKIYIQLTDQVSPKVEVVRSARGMGEGDRDVELSKNEKTEKGFKSPPKDKQRSPKTVTDEGRRSRSPAKDSKTSKERSKPASKSTASEEVFKKPSSKEPSRSKLEPPQKRKSPRKARNESWKEHLSKNSMSTSSTSYMSPPDFSRQNTTASTDPSKLSMYNLRKKPQQTNVDRYGFPTLKSSSYSTPGERNMTDMTDIQLLNYMKRLLSMSRNSVDDLGVSSSDVQTPSQSVIEMESNNPMAALQNIIRVMNIRAGDIAKEMVVPSEVSVRAPPNSVANTDASGSKTLLKTPEKNDDPDGCKAKELLLSQYADVTDSCTKRIANLAAMIEQLRQEKIQMLESPPLVFPQPSTPPVTPISDKENSSTRYLELPPSGEKSTGTNSTASIDEDELNRRLIDIDMSLAQKLKRFRQPKNGNKETGNESEEPLIRAPPPSTDQLDTTDHQFLERLHRLIQESHQQERVDEIESILPPTINQASFIPMLIDIPKLPILEPEPEGAAMVVQEKRHPPPSKGLVAAKKFNGNISLIPHELSTIVEADSQLSTKISPNQSRISPTKDVIREEAVKDVEPQQKLLEKSANFSESTKSLTCTQGTCTSLASSSSTLQSSSSSEDMKSIEAMLKSIGMDWAIPTLHKTQEALALSSSSSSGDLSSKMKKSSRKSSGSEVSLKDFLKNQMISKISSSSLNRSDASPASFMRECSDISAIQGNSSSEKTKQRTSTPVLPSKSVNKSKEDPAVAPLFASASDISSVRNSSGEGSCGTCSKKATFQSLGGEDDSSSIKSSVE